MHLWEFFEHVNQIIDKGILVDINLDFEKTFHKVPHEAKKENQAGLGER